MARQAVLIGALAVLIFLLVQTFSYAVNTEIYKNLTPREKQELATEARQEISRVIERNLITFLTLVGAAEEIGKNRVGFDRQDEDEEQSAAEVAPEPEPTLDPTLFPQLASILGAVFSGKLNISGIVDQTFVLVPNSIRSQVDGLFKLLMGQPAAKPTAPPKPTPKVIPTTRLPPTTPEITTQSSEQSTQTESYKNSLKGRYRLNKNRTTPSPDSSNAIVLLPGDEKDTIFRLEQKLVKAAVEVEPYVITKEARVFRAPVREMFARMDSGNFNFTQLIKFLPDLFKGATKAFEVLENLGEIAAGADIDDVDEVEFE